MEQQLHAETPRSNGSERGSDKVEMSGVTWSITELAEEFGLTTRAVRFYEDKGLLSPERRGQTRIYHPRDRARLILIVRGKNVGLALAEIKEILSLYDQDEGCETQNRVALGKFRKRVEQLHEQRREIDLQIKTLEESCARLEAQIERQVKAAAKVSSASVPAASAKTKKSEKAIV